MVRKLILVTVLLLELVGVFSFYISRFSVQEEHAPEDLLQNVMNKVSDRLRRSIERDGGTFGMRLTGDEGIVWNNLNNEKTLFSVGTNRYEHEILNDRNEYALRATRNNNDNIEIDTFHDDSNTDIGQEINMKNSNVIESTSIEPDKEQFIDDVKLTNVQKISNKTYGMNNIGGYGTVQNDLDDIRISHGVGKRASKDDEIINKRIKAFHSFLRETPSTENPIYKEPNLIRQINQQPVTVKSITEKTNTEKPIANEPSTQRTIAVPPTTKIPSTTKTSIVETKIEESKLKEIEIEEQNDFGRTYGMSLTGDQGIVWNDLNGKRISYHVGDEDTSTLKTNKDDRINNEKSEQLKKSLKEATQSKEIKENPIIDGDIENSITMTPKIEPLTDKPIIYEPLTEEQKIYRPSVNQLTPENMTTEPMIESRGTKEQDKQVKAYRMSLTENNDDSRNAASEEVLLGEHKPMDPKNNDNNKSKDELLNDIDEIFKRTHNIIAEFLEKLEKSSNDSKIYIRNIIIDVVNMTLANETAKLKEELKDWIKEEVARQIKDSLEALSDIKTPNNTFNENNETKIIEHTAENIEKSLLKKRPENDIKTEKEHERKIVATNVYGNSMGDGNVTNIFIFNINEESGNANIKPLNNKTGINEDHIKEGKHYVNEKTNENITPNPTEIKYIDQTRDDFKETVNITNTFEKEKSYNRSNVNGQNKNGTILNNNSTEQHDNGEIANEDPGNKYNPEKTDDDNAKESNKTSESNLKEQNKKSKPNDDPVKLDINFKQPTENTEKINIDSKEPNVNLEKQKHNSEEQNNNVEKVTENPAELKADPEKLKHDSKLQNENIEKPKVDLKEQNNITGPNENLDDTADPEDKEIDIDPRADFEKYLK